MKSKQKIFMWGLMLGLMLILFFACARDHHRRDTTGATAELVFPPSPMEYIEMIE